MTRGTRLTSIVTLSFVAVLAACSGGGGAPVPAPAVITTQPADQAVVEGTTATFSVVATNATGYQWQRSINGGATFTDVGAATAASYVTPTTTMTDHGTWYRVTVSGAGGSVTSNAAQLTVTAAPVAPAFTAQPASVTVMEGQNATFTVAVTGTPTPTLQWQQSSDGGATWTDVAGATGTTLDVLAVPLSGDGWQYRAVASNAVGTVASGAATLTVQAVPAFTAQPASVTAMEGQNATFTVAVTGAPTPTLQWQQSTDGGATWTDVAGATGTTLEVLAVAKSSNGWQYRAVASNAAGTTTSAAAILTVPTAPAFVYQPVSTRVTAGQNARFTAIATGTPSPTYQWQQSSDGGATWTDVAGATSASLNLAAVPLTSDGWQYHAVASNVAGTATSSAAVLTVQARSWTVPVLVETNDVGDASDPDVAVDANGDALAVWVQDGDATAAQRLDVWASRSSAGVWGAPTLIETDDTGNAYAPRIAFDASGNALAVWQQNVGGNVSIWANRFASGSWGTASLIGINGVSSQPPRLAIDSLGNALVVWLQVDSSYHIWANRYTAGTGWGTPAAIESNVASAANTPTVAFDASGNAIAVWSQTTGTAGDVWANRYTAGTGWGTATRIEPAAGNAFGAQVAFGAGGSAMATWARTDGAVYSAWASRYAAGVWEAPTLLEVSDTGSAGAPQLAFDSNGNGLAVWSQSNGAINNIWANRYTAGAGWGSAGLLETDNGSFADDPQLGIDGSGNALAIWKQYRPIAYNRYVFGAGWGAPAKVDANLDNQVTINPSLAVDSSGNAVAVWIQSDGTHYNVVASFYK